MPSKKKASGTEDARKQSATEANLLAHCAAEYQARIGAPWRGGEHLGAGWADEPHDSPLADALDELRAVAIKVERLANVNGASASTAWLTERIIATEPVWNWRLPEAPAPRQVIVRNASTYFARRLTNRELAIISLLCGNRPTQNRNDSVEDVVAREADAMRRVRERTRTTREP